MFRAALLKTTGLYLLIIMVISVFFSLNLYRISTAQLENSLRRQQRAFEEGFGPGQFNPDENFLADREEQIVTAKHDIAIQLIYTNLIILAAGGALSYILAGYTIRPIERAHESQTRFTGDASHELRSPLSAMKAEIEVSLRDPKLTKAEAITVLKSNLEEVNRLKYLAEYLLDLAKDEKVKLTRERFKLLGTVQEATKSIEGKGLDKKIKIITEVPKDLEVSANPDSLRQIVIILLDNAVKYSEPGKTVTVSAKKSGNRTELSVADRGMGIDPKDLSNIFERFYRADQSRTKNKVEGYGLGLALAKKLAESSGVKIKVTSELGHGSVFTLLI